MKRECQRHSLAKQNYIDTTLCHLVYKVTEHVNCHGEQCHRLMVAGFKHSMGSSLSKNMKKKLGSTLDMGLISTQVMIQHKAFVMEMALSNAPVSRDMFVMAHDVRNIANKRTEETWMKHKKETLSIRLWKDENIKQVFFYQEHGLLDMNKVKQDDAPFTLGFHTDWQMTMLLKFSHRSAISIDATFGTSHSRVSSLSNPHDVSLDFLEHDVDYIGIGNPTSDSLWQYPLYTVMVFDEWRNSIPVAYFIISSSTENALKLVLQALKDKAVYMNAY
jgi:hypothetical protein